MKISLFDYKLPKNLIAQKLASPRDKARLMILDRPNKKISEEVFLNLPHYLREGDVLVFNDSKVIPARLHSRVILKLESTRKKISSLSLGRKIEILLLKQISPDKWQCLLGGERRRVGLKLQITGSNKKQPLIGEVIRKLKNGIWEIKFNQKGKRLHRLIFKLGEAPTPPYIKFRGCKSKLKKDYQTVYAKREGSVAAPTAGLHFTKRLLTKLKRRGIQIEFITLHVGLGTFLPVRTEDIEKHKMHWEYFEIKKDTAQRLNQAKGEGRRIIAVGTTSLRALEASALKGPFIKPQVSKTDLFIYPGYRFRFVDGLITNFHLPRSTLLMLVAAFAGREFIFKAYTKAIKKGYRFYSFGDAMLIL